jgi:hypothetical protein
MTQEILTQSYLKELFNYDPDTGNLIWKASRGRIKINSIAGYLMPTGYIRIGINYKHYYAHQLIWLWCKGILPKELDHINNNKSDNKLSNLRLCNRIQNQRNTKAYKNNSTGYKGVYFFYKKFRARLFYNGKHINLGGFNTAKEAHLAYCKKGKELYGEFFNDGT